MKKERFDVTGMTCSACSSRVQKAVEKLAGTQAVNVNLLTNSMQLEYDEQKTDATAIIAVVEKAGYGAALKGAAVPSSAGESRPKEKIADQQAEEIRQRLV